MQAASQPGQAPHAELPAPDFINGSLTRLRPVLERDLEGLVDLMNEAPLGFTWDSYPWSTSRLRKKFEDEKYPGLWGPRMRHYAITDLDGQLCGVLQEEQERNGNAGIEFHLALAREDRETLGPDALAAYVAFKADWYRSPRIEANLLSPQASEHAWLLAVGFVHEFTSRRCRLHLGEVVDLEMYGWHPQWVLDNRADDGIGV